MLVLNFKNLGMLHRKLTKPKEILFSSTIELLCDEGKKTADSMNPTPKVPTVGGN
jgi:hypothetical protein